MPGFNIAPFGGGLPGGPSNTTEVRRKHRWAFETIGRGTGSFAASELLMLQSASRPSIKFEEPEMHHNQEVARFAGKHDWDPITLVWYDGEQQPDISRGIYHWIETVLNIKTMGVAHPAFYKRMSSLQMLDGTGQPNEQWTLMGTWPTASNFQELDMTSTDLMTVEVTMRFDRAVRALSDGSCLQVPQPRPIIPNCPN